jgi:hypothetical protein
MRRDRFSEMVGEATEMRRHVIVRVLVTAASLAAVAPVLLTAPALVGPPAVIGGGTGPSTDGGITWVVAGGITWVAGDA